MRMRSLRFNLVTKFNLLILSLVLYLAIGIGFFASHIQFSHQMEELTRHSSSVAAMIAQTAESAFFTEDQDALRRVIKQLSSNPDVGYIAFLNPQAHPLLSK